MNECNVGEGPVGHDGATQPASIARCNLLVSLATETISWEIRLDGTARSRRRRGPRRLTIIPVMASFVYGNYFIVRTWPSLTDLATAANRRLVKLTKKKLISISTRLINIPPTMTGAVK